MNARQKAKKYKRMYKELLNRPIEFKVEYHNHKIDTLRFEQFYPETLSVEEDSSYLREVMVRGIAQGLASSMDKYIDYNIEFCPHINKYRYYGEIKVINRL